MGEPLRRPINELLPEVMEILNPMMKGDVLESYVKQRIAHAIIESSLGHLNPKFPPEIKAKLEEVFSRIQVVAVETSSLKNNKVDNNG